MAQAGYCTSAQVGYARNSQEIAKLLDRNRDGSADTGVETHHIMEASYIIFSIAVLGRADYRSLAALNPATYDPATYPAVQYPTARLAGDLARGAYRKEIDGSGLDGHPSVQWAKMVRSGMADIA